MDDRNERRRKPGEQDMSSVTMMTNRTYAAQANGMAAATRVRGVVSCPAPSMSLWSPIFGTHTDKHGRPRRTEVSLP